MPTGKYIRTEEHRRKMSERLKGCIHTKEHLLNMSKSLKGIHRTEEQKINLSRFHTGKVLSAETRKKIGEAQRGTHLSEETRRKISIALSGNKSHTWRGGITNDPYPLGWTRTYKEQIRNRDGYKCKICGCSETECIKKLSVHHIDYNKMNITPSNLVSLCTKCHSKTNSNREYWKEHFQNAEV